MSLCSVRPFDPGASQYAALAQVETEVFPDHPITAASLERDDKSFNRDKCVLKRYLAWEPSGNIAGHAVYHHMESRFHPQRFWVWVAVRPGCQRNGIGSALYERIMGDLVERDARWLHTSARETMPHARTFLERRGFRETLRSWESHLEVQRFDPGPFASHNARMQEQGIVLSTLAHERQSRSRWLEEAYELHTTLMNDVPSTIPYTQPSLETFARHCVDNPEALLDGYFIAIHEGRFVGESALFRSEGQPESLYQGLTAVRRAYRGRGVAMALKLATIGFAQGHRYTTIKTWNATVNERMLQINDRLGFVRQPAWVEMEREIGSC